MFYLFECLFTNKQIDQNGVDRLDSSKYEIVLLLNAPKKDSILDITTEREIERFKKDFPDFNVHLIKKNFDFDGPVVMGEIYKTVGDICIYRNLNRESSIENKKRFMMRTGAGDAKEKNKYFLSSIINKASSITRGKLGRYRSESRLPKEILEKFPLLHILYFMESGLNRIWTRGCSNIGLGTYSGSLYTKVGGFDKSVSIAEDKDLSFRLSEGLKYNDEYESVKTLEKNAIDDPRRNIKALYEKNPSSLIGKYDNFGDNNITDVDWDKKVLNEDLPDYLVLSKENIEREMSKIYRAYIDNVRINSITFNNWVSRTKKDPVSKTKTERLNDRKNKIYEITDKLFSRLFVHMGINKNDYRFIKKGKEGENLAGIELLNFGKLEKIMSNRNFQVYDNFK